MLLQQLPLAVTHCREYTSKTNSWNNNNNNEKKKRVRHSTSQNLTKKDWTKKVINTEIIDLEGSCEKCKCKKIRRLCGMVRYRVEKSTSFGCQSDWLRANWKSCRCGQFRFSTKIAIEYNKRLVQMSLTITSLLNFIDTGLKFHFNHYLPVLF